VLYIATEAVVNNVHNMHVKLNCFNWIPIWFPMISPSFLLALIDSEYTNVIMHFDIHVCINVTLNTNWTNESTVRLFQNLFNRLVIAVLVVNVYCNHVTSKMINRKFIWCRILDAKNSAILLSFHMKVMRKQLEANCFRCIWRQLVAMSIYLILISNMACYDPYTCMHPGVS